jgi:putative Holliday junction resolvase
MDGSEQDLTFAARRFARRLEGRFGYPVFMSEERLTTKEAKAQLFEQYGYQGLNKSRIDSYAASLILEEWLRSHF